VTDLPLEMNAVDPVGPGGPEVLRVVRRALPRPAAGEVLIRVVAAGVNRPDVAQRQGIYPPPPGITSILGLEASGTVVALGEGADAALLGKRVCALLPGGGYAEYVAVASGHCLVVPDGLSMVEAAALPETLFTVWSNMVQRAGVRSGERVLVHGGTSGIGTMAIALGSVLGLEVIVTCGSAEKCAAAIRLGAAHAINYREMDFVAEVMATTGGAGVAVVLDMVGGDYLPRNLECLADEGRHVSIALQRGIDCTLPIWMVMMRRLSLTGSTLRARDDAFKSALRDDIAREAWPHVASGRLQPLVDRTFALGDAAAAHRCLEGGHHVGKIVLQVAD
jgi:NADPH2:quinone reductase